MPTDTEVVYVTREDFDAACRRWNLTPEENYAEGYIEATYRKTIRYRTATEENDR